MPGSVAAEMQQCSFNSDAVRELTTLGVPMSPPYTYFDLGGSSEY